MDQIFSKTEKTAKRGKANRISNTYAQTVGIQIVGKDGTKVRFNLPVGQTAEFTIGEIQLEVNVHEAFEDLVGVKK